MHEFPVGQCAQCAPDAPVSHKDKPLLGVIIKAKFPGTCYACGECIKVDDHIGAVLEEDGEWAHYGCGR